MPAMSVELANLWLSFKYDQVEEATRIMTEFGEAAREASPKMQEIRNWSALGNAFNTMGTALVGMSTKITGLAADLQRAQISFRAFLGSADRANTFIADLQKFSAQTPFLYTQWERASRSLLAYGYSATQVKDVLKDIGNVAAATGAELEFVADAFAQIKVGNVGIGLATLRSYGLNTSAVRMEMMNRGYYGSAYEAPPELTIESVRAVVDRKFSGLMDQLMDSFAGAWSNLKDVIEIQGRQLGMGLVEGLTPMIRGLSGAIGWLSELSPDTQSALGKGVAAAGVGALAARMTLQRSVQRELLVLSQQRAAAEQQAAAAMQQQAAAATQTMAASGGAGRSRTYHFFRDVGEFGVRGAVGSRARALSSRIDRFAASPTNQAVGGAFGATFGGLWGGEIGASMATGSAKEQIQEKRQELFYAEMENNTSAMTRLTDEIKKLSDGANRRSVTGSIIGGGGGMILGSILGAAAVANPVLGTAALGTAVGLGWIQNRADEVGRTYAETGTSWMGTDIDRNRRMGMTYAAASKNAEDKARKRAAMLASEDIGPGFKGRGLTDYSWEATKERGFLVANPLLFFGTRYFQQRALETNKIEADRLIEENREAAIASSALQTNPADLKVRVQTAKGRQAMLAKYESIRMSEGWDIGTEEAISRGLLDMGFDVESARRYRDLQERAIKGEAAVRGKYAMYGYSLPTIGPDGQLTVGSFGGGGGLEAKRGAGLEEISKQYETVARLTKEAASDSDAQLENREKLVGAQEELLELLRSQLAIEDEIIARNQTQRRVAEDAARMAVGPQVAAISGPGWASGAGYFQQSRAIESINATMTAGNLQAAANDALRQANMPGRSEQERAQLMGQYYTLSLQAGQTRYDAQSRLGGLMGQGRAMFAARGGSLAGRMGMAAGDMAGIVGVGSDAQAEQIAKAVERRDKAYARFSDLKKRFGAAGPLSPTDKAALAAALGDLNSSQEALTRLQQYGAVGGAGSQAGREVIDAAWEDYRRSYEELYYQAQPAGARVGTERGLITRGPYGTADRSTVALRARAGTVDSLIERKSYQIEEMIAAGRIAADSLERVRLEEELNSLLKERNQLRMEEEQLAINIMSAEAGIAAAQAGQTGAEYELGSVRAMGMGGARGKFRAAMTSIAGRRRGAQLQTGVIEQEKSVLMRQQELAAARGDEAEVLSIRGRLIDKETELLKQRITTESTIREAYEARMESMRGEFNITGMMMDNVRAKAAALGFGSLWVFRQELIPMLEKQMMQAQQMMSSAQTPEDYLRAENQYYGAMAERRKLANPLAQLATTVFGGPSGMTDYLKPIVASVASYRIQQDPEARKAILELRLQGDLANLSPDQISQNIISEVVYTLQSSTLTVNQGAR